MQINQVDQRGRIFQISDVLDESVMDLVNKLDWLNLPVIPFNGPDGEKFNRSTLDKKTPELIKIATAIESKVNEISNVVGKPLRNLGVDFWIDYPGFNMSTHLDIGLNNVGIDTSLQLYLICPNENHGTAFYSTCKNHLVYQFKSIPNTGYLMLNHLDENGSDPLNWHGMTNPVPRNTFRVSAYWYLKQ